MAVPVLHAYEYDIGILKDYGTICKLTYFKKAVRMPGFELEKDKKNKNVNDEKLENNIARARAKIYEYGICNDWEYFVTLTLSPQRYNRHDLEKYQKELADWLRNYNTRKHCKIKYLLIPEQHKDGAWHMHGLMSGIPSEHLKINEHGYLDWNAYRKKFGYISLDKVREKEACAKYITKYITKDMSKSVSELNSHMYYCSKGLKTAIEIFRGKIRYHMKEPPDYENEWVKTWTSPDSLKLQKCFKTQ